MYFTVIQRLRELGLHVFSGTDACSDMLKGIGGISVRNDRGGKCRHCNEANQYHLVEALLVPVSAPALKLEWMETLPDNLGIFCNTCGNFKRDAEADRKGYLGSRLPDRGNLFEVVNVLEREARPLEALELTDLHSMRDRLRYRLEAVELQIQKRTRPYRGDV